MTLINPGPAVSTSVNQAPGLPAVWNDPNGSYLLKPNGAPAYISAVPNLLYSGNDLTAVPTLKTIATLDSATGWGAATTSAGVGGTSVFNATGGPWGSGCFDWTSPSQADSTRRDFTASYVTSGGVGVWVKDDNNYSNPTVITIHVADSSSFNTAMIASAKLAYNGYCPNTLAYANGYRLLWIPAAQFATEAGAPTFEGTTWGLMRVLATAGSGGANAAMHIGPIVTCAAAASTPRIAFTTDDSNATDYTTIFAAFEPYGIKATSFIIPSNIGTSTFLTAAQLKRMYNAGWDIAMHDVSSGTWTMANPTEGIPQTAAQVLARMKAVQDYLLSLGFYRSAYYAAFPGGSFDQATLDACAALNIKAAFRTGPAAAATYSTTSPLLNIRQKTFDPYTIGRVFAQNQDNTTGAIQRGALTAAFNGKCDIIHGNHGIGGSIGTGINWAAAEFTDFLTTATTGLAARVAAAQVQAVTVSEMFP